MEEPGYELRLESRTDAGKDIYRFVSADGVASKESFRDAELALADTVEPLRDDDVLVVQANYGFLGVVLADMAPEGETTLAETSDRAVQLSEENLERNKVENASCQKVAHYSELEAHDITVYAPASYAPVDLVKHRLGSLVKSMEENQELWIAGSKTDGIKRYRDYLDSINGELEEVLGGHQKVYRYEKETGAEPELPRIEKNFSAEVGSTTAEFTACKGLFSPGGLDKGTRLLIENVEVGEDEKVLDLGCGYAAVGVFLENKYEPELYLSDDNRLATFYAEKNLEDNGITEYSLETGDCLDGFPGQEFNLIVSNPPTHQGRGVTQEMFEGAYEQLVKGGRLYIVYNRNMGYREELSELFAETEVLAEENNFQVLKAVK